MELLRNIDGLTAIPQGLFDQMLLLGQEARASGQHILVRGKKIRGQKDD